MDDLNPIWVRLLGRSQLSNPSDLPRCFFLASPEDFLLFLASFYVKTGVSWVPPNLNSSPNAVFLFYIGFFVCLHLLVYRMVWMITRVAFKSRLNDCTLDRLNQCLSALHLFMALRGTYFAPNMNFLYLDTINRRCTKESLDLFSLILFLTGIFYKVPGFVSGSPTGAWYHEFNYLPRVSTF